MIIEALKKLVKKENLSSAEMALCMEELLEERADNAKSAAFLTALRMKGETVEEITSCVKILKEKGQKLSLKNKDTIDIVGTGGDGTNTFNISTATAFVVAAGGVQVAKHGSRASSSKSGAADILETLGANIMLNPAQNEEVLNKVGLCFMFAQKFNPLMKNTAKVRSEIKIRTIFNCLGPLINPSCSKKQLVGVYDKNLVEPIAYVMKNLGIEDGMTISGEEGLDEASVISRTYFARIKDNEITTGSFSPEDFGIKKASLDEIKGGTPAENKETMEGIFQGKIKGAKLDIVVLNSALAFLVSNKVNSVEEGVKLAYDLIESGKAYEKLLEFIRCTNEYSG